MECNLSTTSNLLFAKFPTDRKLQPLLMFDASLNAVNFYKTESDMTNERKQLRLLLKRHEDNFKLLLTHSESWRDEDRERGAVTLQNLTLQMERLLKELNKRQGRKPTE
ncbi:hypothetical protein BK667_29440 [Pseudomonas frederiksbergensis]|nr:hypothetical protein BK667_29440 [Pseudomonas frederiksbergensis]